MHFKDLHKKFNYETMEFLEKKRSRLFLAGNLKNIDEDATSSIFMACLIAIKELRDAFLKAMDKKIGRNASLHSFSQIPFNDYEDKTVLIPDGLLAISEGKENPILGWTALVEFKTKDPLNEEQIDRYAKNAKKIEVDSIITISNDFTTTPNHNPFSKRNTKQLSFYHFSWKYISTILSNVIDSGIRDEDQIYLAKQLLMFLNENKKYIKDFDSMGKNWHENISLLRETTTLSPKSRYEKAIIEIASDWIQEERDICLCLKKDYNKKVSMYFTQAEKKDTKERMNSIAKNIWNNKELISSYEVNLKAKNPFSSRKICINNLLKIDTRKQKVSIVIDNKIKGKINLQFKTLIKGLKNCGSGKEDKIKIEAFFPRGTIPIASQSLQDFIKDLNCGNVLQNVKHNNNQDVVRKFVISISEDLQGDFSKRKTIIKRIENNIDILFSQIIEPFAE